MKNEKTDLLKSLSYRALQRFFSDESVMKKWGFGDENGDENQIASFILRKFAIIHQIRMFGEFLMQNLFLLYKNAVFYKIKNPTRS